MQRGARCKLITVEPHALEFDQQTETETETRLHRTSGRSHGGATARQFSRTSQCVALLLAAIASLHIFLLHASAAATAGANSNSNSNSSSTPSIHALASSLVLDTLRRHNDSGQLPPLAVLNDMLRDANGEGAVRLDESFATASAANTAASMNELMAGLDLTGAAAAGAGAGGTAQPGFDWAGFTPPTFTAAFPTLPPFSGSPPPPFPGPPPPNLFGGTAAAAAAGAGAGGASGGVNANPSLGASGSARNGAPKSSDSSAAADGDGLPPLATKVDRALAQASCVLRFGMTDIAYGFLNVAAFQLAAVGQFVDINGMNTPLRYALTGVSNELRSIAYVFVGIQGVIRVNCALEDLSVGLSYRARGEEGGPVFGPGHTPSLNGGTAGTTPPGYAGFNPLAAGEYDPADSAFRRNPRAQPSASDSTSSDHARRARVPRPSCPTFLYGSWMRIENGATAAATSAGDSAQSSPGQQGARPKRKSHKNGASSVVLHFSADSYERVESHSTAGRRRVSQQRWTGPLLVECEWNEMEEEEEEEEQQEDEEDEHGGGEAGDREDGLEDGNDGRSTATEDASLLRLGDELEDSMAMPIRAAASITVRIPASCGPANSAHPSASPVVLHFTYLPLLFKGNNSPTPVLVEGSAADPRDASFTLTDISYRSRPAFIKL